MEIDTKQDAFDYEEIFNDRYKAQFKEFTGVEYKDNLPAYFSYVNACLAVETQKQIKNFEVRIQSIAEGIGNALGKS